MQRDPQIRDGMADALASFQALAADIAATAPTKVLDLHGLRSVTLAIIAVLNGLSSLGATMQDPAELIGTTSALRDIMFGGR